jgi:K+-transporting ATPase A subunit
LAATPVERLIYRLTGVDEKREMRWTEYAVTMLMFSVVSMIMLYLLQRESNGFAQRAIILAACARIRCSYERV